MRTTRKSLSLNAPSVASPNSGPGPGAGTSWMPRPCAKQPSLYSAASTAILSRCGRCAGGISSRAPSPTSMRNWWAPLPSMASGQQSSSTLYLNTNGTGTKRERTGQRRCSGAFCWPATGPALNASRSPGGSPPSNMLCWWGRILPVGCRPAAARRRPGPASGSPNAQRNFSGRCSSTHSAWATARTIN